MSMFQPVPESATKAKATTKGEAMMVQLSIPMTKYVVGGQLAATIKPGSDKATIAYGKLPPESANILAALLGFEIDPRVPFSITGNVTLQVPALALPDAARKAAMERGAEKAAKAAEYSATAKTKTRIA